MKKIKLPQGFFALVDDEDYDYLNQFKWRVIKAKHTNYVYQQIPVKIQGQEIKYRYKPMHRIIMNTPDHLVVGHIDHNGLNCQKSNMRNCTHKQNKMNTRTYGKSKYAGVSFYKIKGFTYIRAGITVNDKRIDKMGFKTEEEAARFHDELAKKYHGEFAYLNFK